MADRPALWTETEDGERRIVSKCGLYCDTCPAFHHGLCNGCPRLDMGDCVVRDCAHLKEVGTCHDCQLDSCYHFEAYTARRQMMRERTRILMAKLKNQGDLQQDALDGTGGCGGCGSGGGCGTGGGCGSGGGCSGCSVATQDGGCGAMKIIEALENLA